MTHSLGAQILLGRLSFAVAILAIASIGVLLLVLSSGSEAPPADRGELHLTRLAKVNRDFTAACIVLEGEFGVASNAVVRLRASKFIIRTGFLLAGKLELYGFPAEATVEAPNGVRVRYPNVARVDGELAGRMPQLSELVFSRCLLSGRPEGLISPDITSSQFSFVECRLDLSSFPLAKVRSLQMSLQGTEVRIGEGIAFAADYAVIADSSFSGNGRASLGNARIMRSSFAMLSELSLADCELESCRVDVRAMSVRYGFLRLVATRVIADSVSLEGESLDISLHASILEAKSVHWPPGNKLTVFESIVICDSIAELLGVTTACFRACVLLDPSLPDRLEPQKVEILHPEFVREGMFAEATIEKANLRGGDWFSDLQKTPSGLTVRRVEFTRTKSPNPTFRDERALFPYSRADHDAIIWFARNVLTLSRFNHISFELLQGKVPTSNPWEHSLGLGKQ